jgi:hypothetical protein
VIWLVAGLIGLVNLPFGYWRAGLKRYSFLWLVAIHAPVPIAVGLRFAIGLGFDWKTLPLFVAAFFLGQLLGALIGRRAGRLPQVMPEAPEPGR